MKPSLPLHKVAILSYESLSVFEFSCALEIFALPRPELDQAYVCEVLAVDSPTVNATGGIQINCQRGLEALPEFGTVVIPGWSRQRRDIPEALATGLRHLMAQGGRLVAICSGSFLPAELGLLDGQPAVTHWAYSDEFKQRFPKVDYQGDVLYTQSQQLYTSAGSSAGLDLCLQILRQDHGYEKANQVARRLVIAPHRSGGQAQYIEQPMSRQNERLSETLDWAITHLNEVLTIDHMAEKACLSRRSFDRQFRAALGISPKQWLIQQRIIRAKALLESSSLDIEQVAAQSGFEKAINLRHHFKINLQISPSQYRQQFGRGWLPAWQVPQTSPSIGPSHGKDNGRLGA